MTTRVPRCPGRGAVHARGRDQHLFGSPHGVDPVDRRGAAKEDRHREDGQEGHAKKAAAKKTTAKKTAAKKTTAKKAATKKAAAKKVAEPADETQGRQPAGRLFQVPDPIETPKKKAAKKPPR